MTITTGTNTPDTSDNATRNNAKHRPRIILIGGVELFIQNRPLGQLQFGPENPGTISIDCIGQAWQIAHGLLSDGYEVVFVSVAGNDFAGHAIKERLRKEGVAVNHFHLLDGSDTAAKHEILNLLDQPEMEFENDEVFSHMTTDMIDHAAEEIETGDCIVLETRFPEAVINHIVKAFPQKPIMVCPMSQWNADRAKGILGSAKGLLVGRRQAEVLSGLSILSEEELQAAASWFFDAGIEQVFIDLGFGGVYYKDKTEEGAERPGPVKLAAIVGGFANRQPAGQTAAACIETQGGK
jgi:pseudouridine kinase